MDGTVAKVEFLANGSVIGQSTSAPYGMTWTPAAVGSYVLTARATDNLGAVTTSANSATVTVNPGEQHAADGDVRRVRRLGTAEHGARRELCADRDGGGRGWNGEPWWSTLRTAARLARRRARRTA